MEGIHSLFYVHSRKKEEETEIRSRRTKIPFLKKDQKVTKELLPWQSSLDQSWFFFLVSVEYTPLELW